MKLKATIEFEYEVELADYGVETLRRAAEVDQENPAAVFEVLLSALAIDERVSVVPVLEPHVPYVPVADFRAMGLLQEVNRLVLHPLGMALETKTFSDGSEHLGGIWDFRDDPEGIIFDNDYAKPEKARDVANMLEAKGVTRHATLGYVIQPLDPAFKQLTVRVLEQTFQEVRENPYIAGVGEFDEGEQRPAELLLETIERVQDEDEVKERDMTEAEEHAYLDDDLSRDAA